MFLNDGLKLSKDEPLFSLRLFTILCVRCFLHPNYSSRKYKSSLGKDTILSKQKKYKIIYGLLFRMD